MVYTGAEMMDENASNTLPNGIDTHFRQTHTRTLLIIN